MYPLLEIYLTNKWMPVDPEEILSLNQSEAHLKTGTLDIVWDLSNAPALGKDDPVAVRIKKNQEDSGTVIFSGKITGREFDGITVTYTASNILNDLQRVLMVVGGKTEFNLFRNEINDAITIGQQISAAIDYAAGQGIAVSYDQSEINSLNLYLPSTQVSEITVYEIIKKALIYRSDIMVAVEYAAPGSASKIRFVNQADLPVMTLLIGTDVATYSAKALYDRQISGVEIKYEWTDTAQNGTETKNSSVDSYGILSGLNVLRQKVPLIGTDLRTGIDLNDHVRVTTADDPLADRWYFWEWLFKALINEPTRIPESPYVTGDSYEITDQYAETPGSHVILISYYNSLTDLQKERIVIRSKIKAQISMWKWVGGGNSYTTNSSNLYGFDPNPGPGGLYGVVPPDEIPVGLAQQLFEILSPIQYSGQVISYRELTTPSGICSILRRLNIAGAEDDLETMSAIIQQCKFDYIRNISTDIFGPATHLEPQDFIALCRANKHVGGLRIS